MKPDAVFRHIERLPSGIGTGPVTPGCIVLEGGAFRGVYTSGVLDALMESGIHMACTVGVSAGAMNGLNYVSRQIGRSGRINLRYRHDPRYVGLHAVRRNQGIIGFDFVFGYMQHVPDFDWKNFRDPDRSFYAVVTNLETAKAEYISRDSGISPFRAVRASASMPYISRPVTLRGKPYLDGGCAVGIPVQWAIEQGFEKIVVVRTRERGFRKSKAVPGDHLHKENLLYHQYPDFARLLVEGNLRYNGECALTERLAAAGRIALIAPSRPPEVGRLEPDMEKLGALYQLGYADGREQLPALCAYLGIREENEQ